MTQILLNWTEVLERDDLIGGDMESREESEVYRGPLSEIKDEGRLVRFVYPWCARLNLETGEWEKCDATSAFVSKYLATPYDIGDGKVFFEMHHLASCTIFPKTSSNLDSKKVKGLPKDSERLLALYPDLPFDRAAAEKICADKVFPGQLEAIPGLPPEATLRDLLAKFRHDSSAEEFLWYYIEAVTNEEDVHLKVY